jgi:hypothetical protein
MTSFVPTTKLAPIDAVVESGRVDPDAVEVFLRDDGMGRSVRTRRAFKCDEVVCSYGGRVLPTFAKPASDYLLQISSKAIVDGNPNLPEAAGHVGNLVNDAKGPIRDESVENNLYFSIGSVKLSDGRKMKTVLLKAKRKLPSAGIELFVSYGPSYWSGAKKAKKSY